MNRLSIIVTTLNAINQIGLLFASLSLQDNKNFDIIVVDADSTDGTIDFVRQFNLPVQLIISPRAGIYKGINIGIEASKTDYYLVCGSDDELSPNAVNTILEDISRNTESDLLLYAVKKGNVICRPNFPTKIRKILGWQSIVASHSVGAVIKRQLHLKFGYYNLKHPILADGYFFSKVFNHGGTFVISDAVVGSFAIEGLSSRNLYNNIFTTFLIQIEVSSFFLQLGLLAYRLIKHRKNVNDVSSIENNCPVKS